MCNQDDANNSKIVVLIGNGLGRAFDNEGFALEHLLKKISSELSLPTRNFFARIFQSGFPENEQELGILEELNDALDIMDKLPFRTFLCDPKSATDTYVDESFKNDFLIAFTELKTILLKSLHTSSLQIIKNKDTNGYGEFSNKLLHFIQQYRPTIGTLNYDNLLFKILCMDFDTLLKQKKGYTDGFYTENAEEQAGKKTLPTFIRNFFTWASENRAAYLHLHGAYFYTLKGSNEIEKQSTKDYIPNDKDSHQVILTSQKKKIQHVYSSPQDFFRTYSGYFFEKLLEAKHIIVFGYGGGDEYLNINLRYAINKARATKSGLKTTIICRDEMPDDELKEKWSKILIGEESSKITIEEENGNSPLSKQEDDTYKIRKFSNLNKFEWSYEDSSKEAQGNI